MDSSNSFFGKRYSASIGFLIILSVLNISVGSDEINSKGWSAAFDIQVTSVTLALVFLFWLPVLLPWLLEQLPQVKSSLHWMREQGVEEIETSLLKIKLSSGVEAASKVYEEKIGATGTQNSDGTSQKNHQEVERQYQDAIALIETENIVEPTQVMRDIDKLAGYYDRIRTEMPSGSKRTRLMSDISSTMWALAPKARDFPLRQRLNSSKAGERLSAYKYLEWYPSSENMELLLSRAIGMLEVPFGQYAALLALRRGVTTGEVKPDQVRGLVDILDWAASIEYIAESRKRYSVITEITSTLKASL